LFDAANPALGLLEFQSIAAGIVAGDAMAKRSPVATLHAGTVHPGRYLVLVGGGVAEVLEALAAGRVVGAGAVIDELFLPAVHIAVVAALAGRRQRSLSDALGVIETCTVSSILSATDAALKEAGVELLDLVLADGLGGKGYALLAGAVPDVEAAIERGAASVHPSSLLVHSAVIAQLHAEVRVNLEAGSEFHRASAAALLPAASGR
jgi:microcompartment protein CcmL/EutN